MSQKGRSGACNVCAAPCSSCMHFDDMEFSGDTCVLEDTSTIINTTTKPESSAAMMDDTDESDVVEHDVKVCDICGDAGREDMLAICSRCTDGAEHTYCMRKMLRKLPARTWMCEECKFADDLNTHNKQGAEGKRLTKSGSSTHFPNKRLAENAQVSPAPKRQALESPRSSSPVKPISLSPDSSFKNSDKDRLRPPQQANLETPHSPSAAASRLQSHKGLLVKSKSFNASNSKPKVQLVDEVLPPKQKGGKDYASADAKERSAMLQKSMSLKSTNSGRPTASDSKVKLLSPRISHTLDSKGSRSLKERPALDRKNLSKSDRSLNSSTSSATVSTPKPDLTRRSESSLLSFSSSTRDLKVQTEGKSTTSKSTGTRRPVEVPVTSVGVSSATEHKFKDDASFTSEKPTSSNSVDGTIADGLPRSQETSMRSRSIVMPNSKSTFCQKCKEIGHSAEFCSSGSLEASGSDSSAPTARSSREEIHGDSKLKEAIHAALLRKPGIQRKKRTLDQVDEISTSSTDLNSEMACHDQATVSNKSKLTFSSEGTHEAPQPILRNSTSDSTHYVRNTDAKPCIVKPVVKDLTSHSLSTFPQLAKMLAIPEYDYIWRGCFEVNRGGSFLELCGGIQAHLSSCVSPRVPEVARKFPQKLSLNEVPRLSAWPTRFYDGGAKEDNIALYFFAKDLESYERNYKSLLDGMIKNDLALKGNFDGVELLIFPSNQLPENSQRWNMLYFLWGVFRARRVHNSESSDKSNVPNDRTVAVDKKAAKYVTATSENVCSPKFIDADSSGRDKSCPEISDRKIFVPISSGLIASAVVEDSRNDTKCSSDANLSDNLRCSNPCVQEKSPPDPKVCLMGGGCNVGEKAQLYCESELNEDVDVAGMASEKKALEGGRVGVCGENDSESSGGGNVKRVELSERDSVGKKRESKFVLGESIPKGLLVEKKVCMEEECEEKVIPEDLSGIGATERRFFPVEARQGNSCGGWKTSCQDQGLGFPNLELALGAETKPQNKGMLTFLVDKKVNRDEDVSASLSLSLSFPMANKERQHHHQLPEEEEEEARSQQAQEAVSMQQRVNTSLLLFGGFPDK